MDDFNRYLFVHAIRSTKISDFEEYVKVVMMKKLYTEEL